MPRGIDWNTIGSAYVPQPNLGTTTSWDKRIAGVNQAASTIDNLFSDTRKIEQQNDKNVMEFNTGLVAADILEGRVKSLDEVDLSGTNPAKLAEILAKKTEYDAAEAARVRADEYRIAQMERDAAKAGKLTLREQEYNRKVKEAEEEKLRQERIASEANKFINLEGTYGKEYSLTDAKKALRAEAAKSLEPNAISDAEAIIGKIDTRFDPTVEAAEVKAIEMDKFRKEVAPIVQETMNNPNISYDDKLLDFNKDIVDAEVSGTIKDVKNAKGRLEAFKHFYKGIKNKKENPGKALLKQYEKEKVKSTDRPVFNKDSIPVIKQAAKDMVDPNIGPANRKKALEIGKDVLKMKGITPANADDEEAYKKIAKKLSKITGKRVLLPKFNINGKRGVPDYEENKSLREKYHKTTKKALKRGVSVGLDKVRKGTPEYYELKKILEEINSLYPYSDNNPEDVAREVTKVLEKAIIK